MDGMGGSWCPGCGYAVEPGTRFCVTCGQPVAAAATVSPAPATQPTVTMKSQAAESPPPGGFPPPAPALPAPGGAAPSAYPPPPSAYPPPPSGYPAPTSGYPAPTGFGDPYQGGYPPAPESA